MLDSTRPRRAFVPCPWIAALVALAISATPARAEPPPPASAGPNAPFDAPLDAPRTRVELGGDVDGASVYVLDPALSELDARASRGERRGLRAREGALRLEDASYRALCVAPCSAVVPLGARWFALRDADGRVTSARDAVDVEAGTTRVVFDRTSRAGQRRVGAGLLVGGAIAGATGLVFTALLASTVSPSGHGPREDHGDLPLVSGVGAAAGLVTGVALLIAGAVLGRTPDALTAVASP